MQSVEQEIQSKGLTAPRVTPDRIKDVIAGVEYHVFPNTTVTVCLLTLANGYSVIGESACADRANFDKELGERIAKENATQKIWALEGYLLRQELSAN